MATQSPFPFLDTFFDRLASGFQPPAWMVDEIQRRMVLLLNHVLMQEPEAQARLARQAHRVVQAHWRNFVMPLVATPAGLLDLAPAGAQPDLTFTLTEESPWGLVKAAVRGDNPPVRIEGDAQFATEINWLVDNVRWDLEEDLARLVGDAPAHAMGAATRRMAQALRQFVRPAPGSGSGPAKPGNGRPGNGQPGPASTGPGPGSTGSGPA
jgi:ubiquinone biosynthesis protein UbiJ